MHCSLSFLCLEVLFLCVVSCFCWAEPDCSAVSLESMLCRWALVLLLLSAAQKIVFFWSNFLYCSFGVDVEHCCGLRKLPSYLLFSFHMRVYRLHQIGKMSS